MNRYFSEYSYGFRPNRDCHKAIEKVLEYLNEGYEWVVDLDMMTLFSFIMLSITSVVNSSAFGTRYHQMCSIYSSI